MAKDSKRKNQIIYVSSPWRYSEESKPQSEKRKRKQIGKFLSEARKLAKLAHGIEEEEDHDQEEEEQKPKEAEEEKDTLDVCSSFNAQLHSDR